MALISVVSIVPADKKTDEHTVPLSADGQEPATHYGLHSWEKSAPVAKPDEILQARADDFHKRETLKQPLQDAEKTGGESFGQIIASLGLRLVVPPEGGKTVDPDTSGEVAAVR